MAVKIIRLVLIVCAVPAFVFGALLCLVGFNAAHGLPTHDASARSAEAAFMTECAAGAILACLGLLMAAAALLSRK
jgi:ABC-type dipeptide/oligopeptide/nickel transport system permease component